MDPDSSMVVPLLSSASGNSNPIVYILILILLIFVNGFFAASEMAMVTLNDAKLKIAADNSGCSIVYIETMTELGKICGIDVGASCACILKH